MMHQVNYPKEKKTDFSVFGTRKAQNDNSRFKDSKFNQPIKRMLINCDFFFIASEMTFNIISYRTNKTVYM